MNTEIEISYKPIVIVNNLETIREEIQKQIAPFKDAELDLSSRANISQAKKIYADLNSLSKKLDIERKKRIKELRDPIDQFDRDFKDLINEVNDAYRLGKNQLDKVAEDKAKLNREELAIEWEGIVGELATLIPYDIVENSSWSNISYGMPKAKKELADKASQVLQDMKALEGTDLEYKSQAMLVFYKTGDITKALGENARLIENKKEEKAFVDVKKKIDETRQQLFGEQPAATNRKLTYTLEFIATKEQALSVRDYVKEIGAQGLSLKGVQ